MACELRSRGSVDLPPVSSPGRREAPDVSPRVRVAVVEDSEVYRDNLREWLEAGGFECVALCGSAEEALERLPGSGAQVVLHDINLPGASGIECVARLKGVMPGVQVVMITVYRDHDQIFRALQAGASGYLLKRCSPDEVRRAVTDVLAGGAPLTAEIARMVVETFRGPAKRPDGEALSPREEQILGLLAAGVGTKEIAQQLDISWSTVRLHLKHIYHKLHVHGREEAVARYRNSLHPSS